MTKIGSSEGNCLGKVYCGYPGVGKSSIGGQWIFNKEDGHDHPIIDMETSLMRSYSGRRPENWVEIYCNYVEGFINQGVNVMCSTHGLVRKELEQRGIEYVNVFPALNIKQFWLDRLQQRWKDEPTDKNKAAYDRAIEWYEHDIKDLMENEKYIAIGIERWYDLKEIIDEYEINDYEKWLKS